MTGPPQTRAGSEWRSYYTEPYYTIWYGIIPPRGQNASYNWYNFYFICQIAVYTLSLCNGCMIYAFSGSAKGDFMSWNLDSYHLEFNLNFRFHKHRLPQYTNYTNYTNYTVWNAWIIHVLYRKISGLRPRYNTNSTVVTNDTRDLPRQTVSYRPNPYSDPALLQCVACGPKNKVNVATLNKL